MKHLALLVVMAVGLTGCHHGAAEHIAEEFVYGVAQGVGHAVGNAFTAPFVRPVRPGYPCYATDRWGRLVTDRWGRLLLTTCY